MAHGKLSKYRGWIVGGCGIAVLVGMAALLGSTVGPFRSVSGQATTAAEANRKLWINHVPDSATDVWFTSSYKATFIDCKLDRNDFLAWCQAKGWMPTAIEKSTGIYLERLDDAVLIHAGLEFNARQRGRGSSGIYDEQAGRAYISYAGN